MKRFLLLVLAFLSVSVIIVMATTSTPNQEVKQAIESLRKVYEIDTDSLFVHLNKMQAKAEKCKNPVSKALYYSYLARYYQDYYEMNRFFIDDRTDIDGPAPKDQMEWTKQNFYDAIRGFVELSVKDSEALLKADINDYKDVVVGGKDSALRPSMYDILMHKGIEIMSYDTAVVNRMYEKLIDAHKDNELVCNAAKLNYVVYKHNREHSVIGEGFAEAYKGSSLYVYAKALELENRYLSSKEKHDICDSLIAEYKDNPYICSIIRMKESVEDVYLSMSNHDGNRMMYPGKDEQIKLWYKGVNKLDVSVYKVGLSAREFARINSHDLSKLKLKLVSSGTIDLPVFDDYETHEFFYTLKSQDYGIYILKFTSADGVKQENGKPLEVYDHFMVSKLFACKLSTTKGVEVYVTDRMSGEPMCGVTVDVKGDKATTVKTDKFGIAFIESKYTLSTSFTLECGNDKYYPQNSVGYSSSYSSDTRKYYTANFFLDRGVYRPGQKVMAKGIVYTREGDNYALAPNTSLSITLRDANYSNVETKKVVTNEYGSFYVEFDIPTGLLGGEFSLSTSYGTKRFRVDEYKRPTFETIIDNVAANTIHDVVKVTGAGKYYRGVGTAGAKVSYNVTSCPVYFCYWAMPQIKANVASGNAECDADGNFSFDFIPSITPENSHPFYRLTINVDITDASGETESTSYSLLIGETSYSLSFPLSGMTDRDKVKDTAPRAYDTAGNEVVLNGYYVITDKDDKEVASGNFTTGKNIDLKGLPSGCYDISLSAKDDKDRSVYSRAEFIWYSLNDKKPAKESVLWVVPVRSVCENNETAEFVIGSSYDTHVLMDVFSEDSLVERTLVDLDSSCGRIKIKYKPSFSDKVTVNLIAVKNGEVSTHNVDLSRKLKPRNLNIELTHIKKVYEPGEKDTWCVKIKDVDGNPITSEVLASMYDISLDAICGNDWYFNPVHKTYRSAPTWLWYSQYSMFSTRRVNGIHTEAYRFVYPYLNNFNFDLYRSRYYGASLKRNAYGGSNVLCCESAPMAEVYDEDGALDRMFMAVEEPVDVIDESVEENGGKEEVVCRENFAETAFFYPQLNAEDGSCVFEFVAPEALTGWKIMLLAHNKDIRTAILTDTIKTQKSLSVNTNLPRFVRTTDKAVIAATIDNISNADVNADVRWTVTDVVSGDVIASSNESVAVRASSQGVTKCEVSVPTTASLLKIRVTAKGGQYTDGVEAMIPVLSSQTLITESMPISLYKEGDFTYSFESMATNDSKTLVNRGYTISVTPDAATLALQSLPYVGEPTFDNAVDYALSYYVNWLSAKAVEGNANIKSYLERLKSGQQNVESPLSANEDLKNILLQESPWVMDAKFETDRNRSLVELLDTKAQLRKREAMLKKLFKLQNSDGGFSWFEGGKSSAYITLFVVEQLSKTDFSGAEMKKALKYLSAEMESDYNKAKKAKEKIVPYYLTINEMFVLGKQNTESYKYYYDYIKKSWMDYTLPTQALIAQVLFADGDKAIAKKIINNIRSYSVFKPTMGLYWPNTSNIYTQADYIKAFATVDPNAEELAKMKLWLLFNKQANMWGNSVATADAIDALVNAGSAVGTGDAHIVVNVGNVTLDSDSAQWAAAIDYKFAPSEVSKDLANVKISKSGKQLTLGAAYWQYTEDVDKVKQHTDSRLTLKKEFYIEKDGVLKPVDLSSQVKVGDKVTVRLVVTADRSMEFIHLRDLRPAGLEPVNQISRCFIMSGLVYYMCTKDCSTDLFFDYMPKGTYVFEYQLKANEAGDFAAGFASIESMYADDFKSQTNGCRMVIK